MCVKMTLHRLVVNKVKETDISSCGDEAWRVPQTFVSWDTNFGYNFDGCFKIILCKNFVGWGTIVRMSIVRVRLEVR